MIRRTFQHLEGVGPWREKDLWARGISTWDDFPPEGGPIVLSERLDAEARARLAQARRALETRDLASLARWVPPREHWRLYGAFADTAVFFDIEAEPVGKQNVPTVVSLFSAARGIEVFIRERNLDDLPDALAGHALWVTFNGANFDVPVLRGHFGERFPVPVAHVDLRHLSRRVKLQGGLKQIEDRLGIGRPPHLRGVNGWDAIWLWRIYQQRQDIEALRFLVEYNLYDAVNLRSVLELSYNRAMERLAIDAQPLSVFERGDVLYDLTRVVLALSPSERDFAALERARALGVEPS